MRRIPSSADSTLPDSRGGERRRRQRDPQAAPTSPTHPDAPQRVTPRTERRNRRAASVAADTEGAPEMCLCVSCGGRFPVDALTESAAARLVKHYRDEIHKRQDRYVAAAVQLSFERRRLERALRALWPRLVTMAHDTRRPALARELQRIAVAFLSDQ